MDQTSLFSALEGQPNRPTAVSPPPTTDPFRAPDFGEDEPYWPEDTQDPAPAPVAGSARPSRSARPPKAA
ncbi:hypothetical protein CTU88_18160 [Streptomyces sp. JV178]|nr:hypothetical protein CTU88_18160 [Streptomyces sp. JV178]